MAVRHIILILLGCLGWYTTTNAQTINIDYYGNIIAIPAKTWTTVPHPQTSTDETVTSFYTTVAATHYNTAIATLLQYKETHQLNDWMYYQLVRKAAQAIAPKKENYARYTLYKWFILAKSGYDATLAIADGHLLFYVHCGENIYDIPYYIDQDKQYVCLNRHDYAASFNLQQKKAIPISIQIPEANKAFSYKVTQLPDFNPTHYIEKDIAFRYDNKQYHFKIKLSSDVQTAFTNYPVVDYPSYFNIPLSKETYGSLIPSLKQAVAGMKQAKGVDYLMRFTRNAFLYEDDRMAYGKEKRLSPEQTLLNTYSDCDDRAALFFYLVKEIYNLPMITLLYPEHITVAVQFDEPIGRVIEYKGNKYTICEPTPQFQNLPIGELARPLRNASYEVAYEYTPKQ